MALFHLTVTQTKRSAGQSAIASAAYRSGEKLFSEYYGEYSDYTRKGGVICSDILLPPQAPQEYQDRQTLWNAVEKAERGGNAQLAYSFDIALQNEFSLEENIALARQFLSERFVSRGIPNIIIRKTKPLGHYGRLRKAYLEMHRPILFNELVLSDRLFEHCAEIDEAAQNRMELIVPQLAKQYGVTERLKAENQMEWVRQMNACKAQAEEVVKAELIYD